MFHQMNEYTINMQKQRANVSD